jgi:hypothetical protein
MLHVGAAVKRKARLWHDAVPTVQQFSLNGTIPIRLWQHLAHWSVGHFKMVLLKLPGWLTVENYPARPSTCRFRPIPFVLHPEKCVGDQE